MSPLDGLAIFAAGLAAGTINVIVGSGSLITFPTLLALGYPPVLANVSNNVGLVPGNISANVAYRLELVGQGLDRCRVNAAAPDGRRRSGHPSGVGAFRSHLRRDHGPPGPS